MNDLKRWALWLILCGLIGGMVWIASRPRPILVDVATVQSGPMLVTINEDGVTRIRERYVVSSPLNGRLLRIALDVGDTVQADQTILARLEPTDPALLDPRALAQAKARVRAAEQKLEAAKAELSKAEVAVQFAEVEMGRARQLRKKQATSETDFAEHELRFRHATENARSAGFVVNISKYELELQKAALLLTDPQQSGDHSMELAVKAPIDGRVLRIRQESSAVVSAGAPLLEIGDPTDLEIVADVLSRDAVRITAGDSVRLQQWGGDHDLQGRVRLIEPSGFTKVSALGVDEQRVNVVIDLVDPPSQRRQLGDNFRVDCQVIVWQSEQVLWLPTSALFRVDEQWHVFVVHAETARLTPLEIGKINGTQAEVLGGLDVNSQVIIYPGDQVTDGRSVAIRN